MKHPLYTAIGLMSGTSLDGVDAAVIETDGHDHVAPKGFVTLPYTPEERDQIRACFGKTDRRDPTVITAARMLTIKHAEAVHALNIKADIIGFHGQTIFHAPKDGITIQIGDGPLLAAETGLDVIDDFRSADVAAGGEGAPLAPIYHAARAKADGLTAPCAILNIGGVANVTWIGEKPDDLIAFDTGPGNALMDDWMKSRTGAAFDADGAAAASGTAHTDLLQPWYGHPYFQRRAPKSLDRDQWDVAAFGRLAKDMDALSTEDGAATLLRFTGDAIIRSVDLMPSPPKSWHICGGGRHNKALMKYLSENLNAPVSPVDDLGWNGDATEAECFAYLAIRSLLKLQISFPGTTGAPIPLTGGTLHRTWPTENSCIHASDTAFMPP